MSYCFSTFLNNYKNKTKNFSSRIAFVPQNRFRTKKKILLPPKKRSSNNRMQIICLKMKYNTLHVNSR